MASEFISGLFFVECEVCFNDGLCLHFFILRLLQVDVCTVVCCSDGSETVKGHLGVPLTYADPMVLILGDYNL